MFRFTIHDLQWLMVVAVSLGWWNEHRKFAAYHELVTSHIRWTPAGGGCSPVNDYGPETTTTSQVTPPASTNHCTPAEAAGLTGYCWTFDELLVG